MFHWKTKFGYAVEELSRAKGRIATLEDEVCGLQADIVRLKEKHAAQCLDVNRWSGKIKTLEEDVSALGKQATASVLAVNDAFARLIVLEQHNAKREEAYRAEEDAYEDRMRPSTNQDAC